MNRDYVKTIIVRTNQELRDLNLSFFSLCKLSDALCCVDPRTCLEQRLAHDPSRKGELTLDALGNFVSFH